MDNTDMVWWSSATTSSKQQDLWSRGEDDPKVDSVNTYTTTMTVNSDSSTSFVSLRALDTHQTNSFVIDLNKDIEICFAFNPSKSSMSDHGHNKGIFTMRLNSDGTSLVLHAQPF
jgi:hypothetical protein